MTKPPEPKDEKQTQQHEKSELETLHAALERQIGPLIQGRQRAQIIERVVSVVASEKFSGPIAHPRHMREYENILPGSANRIIKMAEKEQAHNIETEAKIIDAQIRDQKRGMHYGLASLLFLVAAALVAGLLGNNTLAGMLLGVGVIGVVGAFIKGRFSGNGG
ncbi:MAG: DUF2335 domain-containing protein [Martelella sp.]